MFMNKDTFDEVFSNGGVRVALIGVFAILALFLLVQTISVAKNFDRSSTPATDTITVQGSGQATLPPDVAQISFTVQNTAATVAAAQSATTKQANAALEFVKGQGIAQKDVKTLSYNISPQYSYPNPCTGMICPNHVGTPTITGYDVSETVQVTVRELPSVGAVLNGLGTLGVQNVQGPAFALDDPTAGYAAARADAIDKAKTQALLLQDQLGIRLGKIVNFSESSGPSGMLYGYARGASVGKADAVPAISTGENTYTASVSITYEIR